MSMSPDEAREQPVESDSTQTAPASGVSRRGFLGLFGSIFSLAGWAAFAGATATGTAALVRFFFPNVLFEPASTFLLGRPEDYGPGTVDERWKEAHRVWVVRREDGIIFVLLARCTHLGCTPNWLQGENKFKCPCHGSGFRRNGVNFEGPAPRPLDRLKVTLAPAGQLLVDSNVVYRGVAGKDSDELYPESVLMV